jgi:hypothetical protein
MVGSWLLKIILGIAFVGLVLLEAGSPLIARAQADDAAHEVANEGALVYGGSQDPDRLQERCREVAADKSVELIEPPGCFINDNNDVEARVRKEALSVVLKNWSVTEDWYNVEVSATADVR